MFSPLLAVVSLLTIVGANAVSIVPECFNVDTETHRFTDRRGRERHFHGINVVVKGPPWIPTTDTFDPTWSFSEKDMATLRDLGLNAVRLGMMWPGAEPVKDQYNETYFSIAKDIVEKAAQYNINVLLDMHQDVLSARFCGEGVPDWVINSSVAKNFPEPWSRPYATDPFTGHPSKEDCAKIEWSDYYPTEAVSEAFQQIYDNENGLLDELAEYWSKVATEFKDFSNILGYEIINEPWAGNIYRDPLLVWPQVADKKNLAHVYDTVSAEIWKADPCHNVFFESVTWDEWTVGFESVPSGPGNEYRSVLSYHFYIPPDIDPRISLSYRMDDLKRLKCGGFLSEFSITSSGAGSVLQEADKYLQSWTAWDYKPYYSITGDSSSVWFRNGTVNAQVASDISRTYAQAVAGTTTSMSYDQSTHSFKLAYTLTNDCNLNITEIYLNEALHYPNGFVVSITPPNVATWSSIVKNYIQVVHNSDLPINMKIEVDIISK